MPQLSEKPRLGFTTRNQAWNPGFNVCNSTAALGLQFACSKTVSDPVESPKNPKQQQQQTQQPPKETFFTSKDCGQIDKIGHGAAIGGMGLMMTGPEDPLAWVGLGLAASNEIWGIVRPYACPN